eukprot:gene8950-18516_t
MSAEFEDIDMSGDLSSPVAAPTRQHFQVNLSKEYDNDLASSEISSVGTPMSPNTDRDHHHDDEDEGHKASLSKWLIGSADIVPSRAANYSTTFVQLGIGSVRRIARKHKKEPDFLSSIGIDEEDLEEIMEALVRDGFIDPPRRATRTAKITPGSSNSNTSHTDTASGTGGGGGGGGGGGSVTGSDIDISHSVSVCPPMSPQESYCGGEEQQEEEEYNNDIEEYERALSSTADFSPSVMGSYNGPPVTSLVSRKRADSVSLMKSLACKTEALSCLNELEKAETSDDVEAAVIAYNTVSRLAEGNGEQQKAIGKAGGCKIIITLLNRFISSKEVCIAALRSIILLCRHGEDKKTMNADNVKALGTHGACEAVTTILQHFNNNTDTDLIQLSCTAIRNLSAYDGNKSKLGSAGVCEVVTNILVKNTSQPMICQWTCRVIGNLAANHDNNRSRLAAAGACEITAGLLQSHSDEEDVIGEACWALQNLGETSPVNRARIIAANVIETLLAVLIKHNTSEVVVAESFHTLCVLIGDGGGGSSGGSGDGEGGSGKDGVSGGGGGGGGGTTGDVSTIMRIGQGNTCKQIIKSMFKNINSELVCRWGTSLIYHLSMDESHRSKLVGNN